MKFRHFLIFLFVAAFIWFAFRATFPKHPGALKSKISLCNIENTESWKGIQGIISKIKVERNQLNTNTPTISFIYDTPPPGVMIVCSTNVSQETLFRAKAITAIVSTNQETDLRIGLYRKDGGGPVWGPVQINQSEMGIMTKISHLLDQPDQKKANWLINDHSQVPLILTGYDVTKSLILTIKDVYLE